MVKREMSRKREILVSDIKKNTPIVVTMDQKMRGFTYFVGADDFWIYAREEGVEFRVPYGKAYVHLGLYPRKIVLRYSSSDTHFSPTLTRSKSTNSLPISSRAGRRIVHSMQQPRVHSMQQPQEQEQEQQQQEQEQQQQEQQQQEQQQQQQGAAAVMRTALPRTDQSYNLRKKRENRVFIEHIRNHLGKRMQDIKMLALDDFTPQRKILRTMSAFLRAGGRAAHYYSPNTNPEVVQMIKRKGGHSMQAKLYEFIQYENVPKMDAVYLDYCGTWTGKQLPQDRQSRQWREFREWGRTARSVHNKRSRQDTPGNIIHSWPYEDIALLFAYEKLNSPSLVHVTLSKRNTISSPNVIKAFLEKIGKENHTEIQFIDMDDSGKMWKFAFLCTHPSPVQDIYHVLSLPSLDRREKERILSLHHHPELVRCLLKIIGFSPFSKNKSSI